MDFIAELLADVILAGGFFLFGWCIKHKNITIALLAVALMIIDVIVLRKML